MITDVPLKEHIEQLLEQRDKLSEAQFLAVNSRLTKQDILLEKMDGKLDALGTEKSLLSGKFSGAHIFLGYTVAVLGVATSILAFIFH